MNERKIPIANIYYLFCYVWEHAQELNLIRLNELEQCDAVHDLFGKMLTAGVFHLLRTGLDQDYIDQLEDLVGIRGKVKVSQMVKRALRVRGRVACEFQELSHDVVHNQIVRSTLYQLLRVEGLDKDIRSDVVKAYRALAGIQIFNLNRQSFSKVRLDRNRRYYRLILDICLLLYEQILIDESAGQNTFKEFTEERMHRLFEDFVVSFFRRELPKFSVNRTRQIRWNDLGSDQQNLKWLPIMEADVILENKNRRIIIDTKYYKDTFGGRVGEKLHSDHLYQIMTYLRHRELTLPGPPRHEGMLLYPTVQESVNVDLTLDGFSVKARSIDLAQDWRGIHRSLLSLILSNN